MGHLKDVDALEAEIRAAMDRHPAGKGKARRSLTTPIPEGAEVSEIGGVVVFGLRAVDEETD